MNKEDIYDKIIHRDAVISEVYTCLYCGKSFEGEDFDKHKELCIKTHRVDIENKEPDITEDMIDNKMLKETIYTCKYCGRPFIDKSLFSEHQKLCIGNYHINKNCITCEKYCIHKFAPLEENLNNHKNELARLMSEGNTNKFYCNENREYLTDKHFSMEFPCYELGKSKIYKKEMPCYTEFYDLLTKELSKNKDNLK